MRFLEVVLFASLLLTYIWVWQGTFPHSRAVVIGVGLAFAVVSNFVIHRDRPSALGLRLDNLALSLREVGPATVVLAGLVVASGWILGTLRPMEPETVSELPGLLLWGLLQQYALQAFVLTRLRRAFLRPVQPAAAAAGLFALHHLPNPILTAATLAAGFVWCLLFQRHPSLITLVLSHVALSLALSHSVPAEWAGGMRVGPGYFEFSGR